MTDREDLLRQERLKKLELLKQKDLPGYPISVSPERRVISWALGEFNKAGAEAGASLSVNAVLAGRIRSLRFHGKVAFADLEDETGRLQVMLRSDDVGQENFELFKLTADEGDFIEAHGELTVTKTGEKTLSASAWRMLAKSLMPVPSEYYGLKDTELRLRRRYLDLMTNPEVREMFRQKSMFWQHMRDFMRQKGFWEFETPVLESVPGGAEAEPFVTHHHALNRDFYLRISLELPLKRLLVGGYEKVFEIGRIFRNEGIDAEHLQDYTQMEFYWAYADYKDLMALVREMYQYVIKNTLGSLKTSYDGQEIDWSGEWPVVEFYDLYEKFVGVSPDESEKNLHKLAQKRGLDVSGVVGKGKLLDAIYKKLIRPNLIQPQFMVRPPVEMEPLAKRDDEHPQRVQRVQIMAAGTELGKGFSELNDPLDQRARFEEQMSLREKGDEEAHRLDEDYIRALEYGMPPAAGFGVSERLFSVLVDKPIRETVVFPPMKEEK